MSDRPEEPTKPSDAESLLPVHEPVEEGHDAEGRTVWHRSLDLLPNLLYKGQDTYTAELARLLESPPAQVSASGW